MRVKLDELNGLEVQVSWARGLVMLDRSQKKRGYRFRNVNMGDTVVQGTIATQCKIIALPNREICSVTTAYCDTRDVFDKAKGRRTALKKTLKEMATSPTFLKLACNAGPAEDEKPSFKKVKVAIWRAYFAEMEKGKSLAGPLREADAKAKA